MFDRRKRLRREGEHKAASRPGTDRRTAERRQEEKRQGDRIAYPIGAAPEIVNIRSQVVGLSVKAVRFFIPDFIPKKLALKKGDKVNIALKFHDGQVIRRSGTILRLDKHHSDREYFVLLFERQLPQERINKEWAYLLDNFPDFCLEDFKD